MPVGGQRIDHGHQRQRGGGDGKQVLPLAPLKQKRVDQRQPPGHEEGARFPDLAARHVGRQEPVGQEHRRHAEHDAGDGPGVQAVDQTQRERFPRVARPRLLTALGDPQHEARGHHGRAGQADDEIEPAQQRFGEQAQVQASDDARRHDGGAVIVLGLLQRARHPVKAHEGRQQPVRHAVTHVAHQRDGGARVTGIVDGHPSEAALPMLLGLFHQRRDIDQRRRLVLRRRDLVGLEDLARELARIVVHGLDARRHQHHHEQHQAAEGDHQVKRQTQYRQDVVAVHPGALPALARPEGEEVREYLLVRDDAADDRHQHEHARDAGQPAPPRKRGLQFEMEAVEEVAAARLARRHGLARGRIQLDAHEAAFARLGLGRLVQQLDEGLAIRGRRDEPALGVRRVFRQIALRGGDGLHSRRRLRLNLRLHPARDLGPEEGQRAGQEHGKQHPAEDQACPRVQPGHGLTNALFTGMFVFGRLHAATSRCARNKPPSSAAGPRMPAQARQALRVANTQITPQA